MKPSEFFEKYARHLMIGAAIFFLVVIIVSLGGCSNAEKAAVRGINAYCAGFTYEERSNIVRPRFNAAIAPHRAVIECDGDPQRSIQ